ncbi:hypothetical protein BFRIG_03115 [Peribacillus frigoritolerans]
MSVKQLKEEAPKKVNCKDAKDEESSLFYSAN